MLRTVSFVALSTLFLGAALPAMAKDVSEYHQETVYIGDVDQGTVEGADVILDRIHDASVNVCRDTPGIGRQITVDESTRDCRQTAVETAINDLDNGIVTARYYGLEPQVIVGDNEYGDEIVVKKPA